MISLKLVIAVLIFFSLVKGLAALSCFLCSVRRPTCDANDTKICPDGEDACFATKVLINDEEKFEKGCRSRSVCGNQADLCKVPNLAANCLAYGCCYTDSCTPNMTSVVEFSPSTSTKTTATRMISPSAPIPSPSPSPTPDEQSSTDKAVEVTTRVLSSPSSQTERNATPIVASTKRPTCARNSGMFHVLNPLTMGFLVFILITTVF